MTARTQDHLGGGYGHRGSAVSALPFSSHTLFMIRMFFIIFNIISNTSYSPSHSFTDARRSRWGRRYQWGRLWWWRALGRRVGISKGGWKWSCCCESIPAWTLSFYSIIPTHISIVVISSTYPIKLQKTYALEVGLESGVEDVSSLARREDVLVRMSSFDTLFN